jgi:hypothetical protein
MLTSGDVSRCLVNSCDCQNDFVQFSFSVMSSVLVMFYFYDPSSYNLTSFVYLGSYITKDNDEYIEVQRWLKLANKAYFSLLAVLRCKDIHKKT